MPSTTSLRQQARARVIDARIREYFVSKCYRTDTLQVLSVRWPAAYVLVSWTDGPSCEEVEEVVGLGRGKVQLHRYSAPLYSLDRVVEGTDTPVELRRLY